MLVHYLFEHPYTRALIVFVLCLLLAFIDRIEAFKKKQIFYLTCAVFAFVVWSNVYNDYGMLLLLIAVIVMTYANIHVG